ncbi:MAG: type II toxin-antitoxin system RelE/ParE family toxin [Lachnospiraceae bacterium]|nr:type II toxin-antitoxin system RelE/ParE family toxin [Lachnospiraceae bacterium]
MKLFYSNKKLEKQCTSLKEAQKLFGGDKALAIKLLDRINALENAHVIKDIIMTPPMRFHALEGNKDGFFAIDVKTRKEPWRIILQPLNDNEEPYVPCNIDEVAMAVKIVKIEEVSRHYE